MLALSRAEHEVAKRLFVHSRLAHVATLALSVLALFIDGNSVYYLAISAVAVEAYAWVYRMRAEGRHSLAEEGRRRALLHDALGATDETLAVRNIFFKFSARATHMAPAFEDASYYSSREAPGPERLRELVQESAFWSRHLYSSAMMVAAILAGALFLLILLAVLLVIGMRSASMSLIAARIAVIFLSFLVFSDVITQAIAWHGAASKCDDVCHRLSTNTLVEFATALAVFSDYSVATATTPAIPSFLYRLLHDRIDAAWHRSQ